MGKKNPIIAAVLGLFLGPLGYFYLGWRYAVAAIVVLTMFVVVVGVTGFTLPPWMQYIVLPLLAWKAFTICSVRNAFIEAGDDRAQVLDGFSVAAMAMSDLLVGMGVFTAGAVGLYASGLMFLDGQIIKALGTLLVGTPVLMWLATMVFGFIAAGIEAAFALGAENVFRQQS